VRHKNTGVFLVTVDAVKEVVRLNKFNLASRLLAANLLRKAIFPQEMSFVDLENFVSAEK
jgi:hypothetical protein